MQQRSPVVKRIENKNLVHRAQHVEKVYGKRNFGMPLKIQGEVHTPHQIRYQDIVTMLMTTENHLHIEFQPEEDTPREIVLSGEGQFFQQNSESRDSHRQLKGFHSKSSFDTEMDKYYEEDGKDESRFNKFLDDYEPSKMYKHQLLVQLKTVGGKFEKQGQIEIEASCDNQHRVVKAQLMAQRSPLPYYEESSKWTLKTEVQAVLPDVHSSVQEYKREQGQKQQKFVAKINTEWGSERKQKIDLNINGEQARQQAWNEKINEVERLNTPESAKLRQQMIQKIAFLNKYDISANYENLHQQTTNTLSSLSAILKSWNFWNTQVEPRSARNQQRDGQLTATIVIDPMTHEHANITVKTPVEIIRIESLSLPIKAKPFKLVKPGQVQQSVDSFADIVRDYGVESRQECKVNSRKVRSFDDVIFKAPLTKCYSVLAKDCSRTENPRFAVLMKKIDGEDKAIKVLTKDRDTIEVESKNGKLIVKINGANEENEDTLEEYGIDYSKNLVRIADRDVTVRFDGEEATVKVNPSYKGKQCGLCGHYDDDSEDEFRMSNNELTSDLKSYHKSYSLVDSNCRADLEETHNKEEYKQVKNRRDWYDQDEEESEQQKQKGKGSRRTNENDETEPTEKTEVMEYNHKICFSVKPVKSCPEDSYPGQTKEMKVGFTCLDRSSSEARRLLRDARRTNRPIQLPSTKPSFVETITVPSTCVVY
jgi:hypothetical protein